MKYSNKLRSAGFNAKLLILGFSILFVLVFMLQRPNSPQISPEPSVTPPTCNKTPPSIAAALVHYAASNVTPQQTFQEISVTAAVLARRSPCNFLVFGLGRDSPMWSALNHGGRTVFIEEDGGWIDTVTAQFPDLEAYRASYDTAVSQAPELLDLGRRAPECRTATEPRRSRCRLALRDLPSVFYEVEWDLIMVDAPTGWTPESPGRMTAIYTAGLAARGRKKEGFTDVFVHDVDRAVEDEFSTEFLCGGYMVAQEGRLRHFAIPGHGEQQGIPFCPP